MWHNLRQLGRYRGLIQSLVARELKARYRGSVLGFFWSFVNPLLLLGIYSFVFATILPNKDPNTQPYALFMFCGILPWTWFASSLNEAAGSLISGGNLIKKVLFPAEVLPIVTVLSNMVHFFLGLLILAAFLVGYKHPPDLADLPWFLVIVAVQLLFTTGLALILAALTVHFRDIRDLLSNLLTLWFFATPIIYPWTMETFRNPVTKELWPSYWWLFNLNPFFHLAVSYQEVLFYPGPFGHMSLLLLMAAVSVAVFLAGYWLFDRLRDSFAEAV
jgi:ABC-type polysaccharide/polyol phosphate export permease